ncbi:MAG TPA: hypothetical protein DEA08_37300 [Planctomycetes bacterium]|nr:hypothetical protein [Planctomycetota bacterium]
MRVDRDLRAGDVHDLLFGATALSWKNAPTHQLEAQARHLLAQVRLISASPTRCGTSTPCERLRAGSSG